MVWNQRGSQRDTRERSYICNRFFFSICLPNSVLMNHFLGDEIIKNSMKGWVAFILGKVSKACSQRALLLEAQVVFGKHGCRQKL